MRSIALTVLPRSLEIVDHEGAALGEIERVAEIAQACACGSDALAVRRDLDVDVERGFMRSSTEIGGLGWAAGRASAATTAAATAATQVRLRCMALY